MKEQTELEKLARPLMQYMAKYHNPHTKIILDSTTCEVVEGIEAFNTEDYLID
jgi:hypothetical protein